MMCAICRVREYIDNLIAWTGTDMSRSEVAQIVAGWLNGDPVDMTRFQ